MRNHKEYVHLAVVAITAEHGTAEQIDAENEFYRIMRNDGLWSPEMEDPKSSVVDRMTSGLVLRVKADFTNAARSSAQEERF